MEPPFVNRVVELYWLRDWASGFRYVPLYIYGPEGCGKTRLLKEFVRRFREYFGDDGVALYIDATEGIDLDKALLTSPGVELVMDVVRGLVSGFINEGVGRALTRVATLIIEKALRTRLNGKYVLLAVDDVVKSMGINNVEWYIKWLYEFMQKFMSEYGPRAVNVIATTSEGESLKLLFRHNYLVTRLIWNLNRESFRDLYLPLKPPSWLDFDEVWTLLGGNPRALWELAMAFNWDLTAYRNSVVERLAPIVDEVKGRGLVKELIEVVNDPDAIHRDSNARLIELGDLLIRNNLIIYKWVSTIGNASIPKDPELGIGEYYAWQLPIYRAIIKQLLR
ncbi:ATP-binding protein [Caldivirga sp.]|uniref:ATP-binding protein n=1 Tax=Caldivirga sp. TaxID=2080243 RepID=UPI0025C3A0B5|nr:ATP-binding protein [Caldivirga sp.]